jgi:hypothetical protein
MILRKRAWVAAIALIGSALAACATPQPSVAPSPGQGWVLVQTRQGGPVREGVSVASFGPDAYLVAITVPAGGADGCGTPSFSGFEQSGTTLLGEITRSPLGSGTCAVISTTTFFVALDRLSLPNGVTSIGVSDCKDLDCVLRPAPIPSTAETVK